MYKRCQSINEKSGEFMILYFSLFMILVVVGLGTIHTCLKKQIQNEERIIERLDMILLELKNERSLH